MCGLVTNGGPLKWWGSISKVTDWSVPVQTEQETGREVWPTWDQALVSRALCAGGRSLVRGGVTNS